MESNALSVGTPIYQLHSDITMGCFTNIDFFDSTPTSQLEGFSAFGKDIVSVFSLAFQPPLTGPKALSERNHLLIIMEEPLILTRSQYLILIRQITIPL